MSAANDTNHAFQECHLTHAFNFWLPMTLCVIGILGNSLIFITIHIGYDRAPMNLLLKALALADSIYLLFEFVFDLLSRFTGIPVNVHLTVWHVAKIAQYSSVWHLVVVGAVRHIAVCRPFRVSQICTHSTVYFLIALAWIFSVILEIFPILDHVKGTTETARTIWYVFINNAFIFLFPFALLVFFNGRILYVLYNARYKAPPRQGGHETASEFYEVSKAVIAITVVFLFTYWSYPLPALDRHYFDGFLFDPAHNGMSCFTQGCRTFLYLRVQYISSSTNFFIFCILRKSFRSKMHELVCCQKRHTNSRQSYMLCQRPLTQETQCTDSNTDIQMLHVQ